jgi:hypothetical protein
VKYFQNLILLLMLTGCLEAGTAISTYDQQKHTVKLGDSINVALPALESMQASLQSDWKRTADQYLENGATFYVHYQRTGWIEDCLLTDDELTPYVFVDGTLVAIGWTVLGGARSAGDANAAAAFNQQRSQALFDLSDALRQPQRTYKPRNSRTTCFAQKVGNNTIMNCN